MKKSTKVILGVIIGVLFLYGAFMTFTLCIAAQDYNELEAEYNDALAENKKVAESALDEKIAEADEWAKLMRLEAFARLIDENAVVNVGSDESAIIRLSMGEKTMEATAALMKEYIAFLPDAITAAELKTCILCVVDKNGDVKFGFTFHPDGTSTAFVSNE